MPGKPRNNTRPTSPPLTGPHQSDLVAIIKDLQRRVAKLESRVNTS